MAHLLMWLASPAPDPARRGSQTLLAPTGGLKGFLPQLVRLPVCRRLHVRESRRRQAATLRAAHVPRVMAVAARRRAAGPAGAVADVHGDGVPAAGAMRIGRGDDAEGGV